MRFTILPYTTLFRSLRLLVTLRSGLPRRKGTKKLTQVVPSLAVGPSDCSFSHRTRKASTALHRTKKIGLYFRGVSHLSAALNNSIKVGRLYETLIICN